MVEIFAIQCMYSHKCLGKNTAPGGVGGGGICIHDSVTVGGGLLQSVCRVFR